MPKAAVNGIDLYYEAQGNGETVILVPPNWWPCATWNVGVVPRLSRRYRTLIYNGHGTGRLHGIRFRKLWLHRCNHGFRVSSTIPSIRITDRLYSRWHLLCSTQVCRIKSPARKKENNEMGKITFELIRRGIAVMAQRDVSPSHSYVGCLT